MPKKEPESLLAEIRGFVREDGRFAVTHWPEPRVSNPNFLSEEFARWEAENKSREEEQPR